MRRTRLFWEWTAGFAALSVMLAPIAGCPGGIGDTIGDVIGSVAKGSFYLSNSKGQGLAAAAKTDDGAGFFVYGVTDESGGIEEVQSIVVRDRNGDESFVTFESGRPVHAQGADGSYVHATYETVTDTSLSGTIEYYDAERGEKTVEPFQVDLTQSASSLANTVRQLTGRTVEVTDVPTAKSRAASQVRVTVLSPLFALFIIPFVAIVYVMTIVLSVFLIVLYAVIYAIAAVLVATLYIAFAPLFLIGAILGDAMLNIRVTPIDLHFSSIPDPPVVILVSGAAMRPALA